MEVAALRPPTLCSPGGRGRIGARSESVERGQLGSVCMSQWALFLLRSAGSDSQPEGSELRLPLHTVGAVSCKMRSSALVSARLEVWEAKPGEKKTKKNKKKGN